MEIYYNKTTEEILTRDEAYAEINDTIERNETYLDTMYCMSASELWNMLTPDAQEKIWEEAVEKEMEYNYISREIFL